MSLHPELPQRVLKVNRAQSPQRQVANALVVVAQWLANALGKYQFVGDRQVPIDTVVDTVQFFSLVV